MPKVRVHINKHVIVRNRKVLAGKLPGEEVQPPFAIRTSKGVKYASEVLIYGPCKLVYHPEKPLSCGAVAWIETDHLVEAAGDPDSIAVR